MLWLCKASVLRDCINVVRINREVVVAEWPSKKICHCLVSTSASSEQRVWADLPDSLLHLIIALLSSFHDLLAFTGTCHSWRAAVFSFPLSIYAFVFPPLHLKAAWRKANRDCGTWYYLLSNYKWRLCDPVRTDLSLRRSAPRNAPNYMRYLGCSYGHLIFSCLEHLLLVDVYTGTKVKLPKLQANSGCAIYCGILMAPLSSSSSCLLLFSKSSMFQWRVGTNSWTEYPFVSEQLFLQIVLFKGQMFAMGLTHTLKTISLAPQPSVQEVDVVWGEDLVVGLNYDPWLVVCGDMLLMVDLVDDLISNGTFQVLHFDSSAEPAKWTKMEKLENWALFVSLDRRSPTFSCMNPERWGGKSNCIYVPSASKDSDEPWIAVELGQAVYSTTRSDSYILGGRSDQLESLWVLPSLVYGVGQ
uniref:F-box domain-containing protein n=1 Tax=Aegilops tauschii subsp. strangulata TaxID=200361 RepID=A0A453AWN2_AEGTS